MDIDKVKRSYLLYALLKYDDCEDEIIGFDDLRSRLEQLQAGEILSVNIVEENRDE